MLRNEAELTIEKNAYLNLEDLEPLVAGGLVRELEVQHAIRAVVEARRGDALLALGVRQHAAAWHERG